MIDHWSLIDHLSSYATPPTGGGGSDCFNLLNLHLLYVSDYKYFVEHVQCPPTRSKQGVDPNNHRGNRIR